ncbi:MAG: type II secretion system protein GspK [Arenicellales bacterium]|jgi:type II secretory pathway component PulK|nr:type II secretion system protein GspK [Arenicellales bacterium]
MAARHLHWQKGSVLIVSMVVLVLISAMAARIVYQTRLELQIQQQVNALTRLRALARGAAHQFASGLSSHVEETSNGLALPWWEEATEFTTLTLETGTAHIVPGDFSMPAVSEGDVALKSEPADEMKEPATGLVDAESRLNINTATPEQFMAFPGFSNIIAEAIVSHRDALVEEMGENPDTQVIAYRFILPRQKTEGEAGQAGDTATLLYVASPFRSVRDLLQVEGMTEEILYEVIPDLDGAPADFLTCCSNGRINLNTAPHPVLVAAGFSPEEANMLMSERGSGTHFVDLSISGTVLPQIDEERWQRLEQAITVRSSTFPLTVEVAHDATGQMFTLVARVFLDEKAARFVSWREI